MTYNGFLYSIGAAITWGVVYTISQRILRIASPFALLFVDSLLTTILLLPFVLARRTSLSSLLTMPNKTWLLVLSSLILAAVATFFSFSGIRILGASTASTFEIAYPFFVVLFSYLVFGARPSIYLVIGALLVFAGSAIILVTSN
jgi:drug/metabolite transporter (DMT)-like permease